MEHLTGFKWFSHAGDPERWPVTPMVWFHVDMASLVLHFTMLDGDGDE